MSGRELMVRRGFSCPHCGERIALLLDLSAGSQRYIEDCQVCCNPIEIDYQVEDGLIVHFAVRTA